jgi:putative ABC transport system ATP-binding protein
MTNISGEGPMSGGTDGGAIIVADGLSREYPMGSARVRALQSVDMTIRAGEFVALMGSSGSGKSTLLHLLGCLDSPSSGRYLLEGRDVSRLSNNEKSVVRSTRLGFVFQNFFLIPSLDAYDNVALPLLYQNRPAIGEAVHAALAQVGLSEREHHRPMELSGGERQRVAIARALVARPAILLADEPTGNLDSATGVEIMNLLAGLWREGLTILLVTHDAQVAKYAERILHMRDGRIIREERSHELS